MIWRVWNMGFLVGAALLGCAATADEPMTRQTGEANRVSGIPFSGQVVWVDLEGGFFGIVTDQGKKLDPRGLPADLKKDGLRVSGRMRIIKDVMTFRMWGTVVEITEIRAQE